MSWTSAQGSTPRNLGFSGFAIGAATAVVSGLLIRWLIAPSAGALRPDLRLAGYVALIVAWNLISVGVTLAVAPHPRGLAAGRFLPQMVGFNLAAIIVPLAAAAIALWPVSVLVGHRLSPLRAVRWMRSGLRAVPAGFGPADPAEHAAGDDAGLHASSPEARPRTGSGAWP